MDTPLQWRIYYSDGSTVDNTQFDPFDVPSWGVQVIVQVDNDPMPMSVGRTLTALRDYYWWDSRLNVWFGGDFVGLIGYLQTPGPKKVCFGQSIWNSEYAAIKERALHDSGFPDKSAFKEGERF